jgi:hypothetical protein
LTSRRPPSLRTTNRAPCAAKKAVTASTKPAPAPSDPKPLAQRFQASDLVGTNWSAASTSGVLPRRPRHCAKPYGQIRPELWAHYAHVFRV